MTPYFDTGTNHIERYAAEFLRQEAQPLSPLHDSRPGLYGLSYLGDNPQYADIRDLTKLIYMGSSLTDFSERVRVHIRSLCEVHAFNPEDLDPADFWLRTLAIPKYDVLGVEQYLIDTLAPRWNQPEYYGFGNNQATRTGRKASPWDIVHNGRAWTFKLERPSDAEAELQRLRARKAALARTLGPNGTSGCLVFDLHLSETEPPTKRIVVARPNNGCRVFDLFSD